MKRTNIIKRVILPLVAVFITLFLVCLSAIYWLQHRELNRRLARNITRLNSAYTSILREEESKLKSVVSTLLENEKVNQFFWAAQRQPLLEYVTPLYKQLRNENQITHIYFTEVDRTCFLRVHKPELYGDRINRVTTLKAQQTGNIASGLELGPLGTFALRVVSPWHRDRELVGFLEVGEEIEHVYDRLRRELGVEIFLLIDKKFLERKAWEDGMAVFGKKINWEQLPSHVIMYKCPSCESKNFPEIIKTLSRRQQSHIKINGKYLQKLILPVKDASETIVGQLYIADNIDELIRDARISFLLISFIFLMTAGAVSTLLYIYLGRVARSLEEHGEKLQRANTELDNVLKNLEVRVDERTKELRLEISERKKAEEALKNSEVRYRRLFESAKDGILIINEETGQINDVNQFLIDLLGYVHAEILGKKLWEIGVFKDIAASKENFEELKRKEYVRYEDLPLETKNGKLIPVEFVSNVYTVENRKVVQCNIRDISERKKAESKYKTILNTSMDCFYIIDARQGNILEANNAYCTLMGYSRDELLKMNLKDVEAVEDPEKIARHMQYIIKKGSDRFETRHRAKGGRILDLDTSVNYMKENDIFFVFMRDITERKKLEEELLRARKLESLGLLTGGIAHDFNNILTTILGDITLAKISAEDQDKKKILEKLNEAERASLRAKNFTQQLLTFSKGGEPIVKTIAISGLIKEAAEFSLVGSNVKCKYKIEKDLWPIEGDENQITQVINNLIINSQQAMPDGGVIELDAENITLNEINNPEIKPGRYVKISIEDCGHGIPKENMDKIFDPYFTTKQAGSGLGLASTYSIIKKHNGHIKVASEPGKGSEFTVFLPASEKAPEEDKAAKEKVLKGKGRILVVDDDKTVRDVVGDMLKTIGYDVEFAQDGQEAINVYYKAVKSEKFFSAVIMDLVIAGGMGGKKAMAELKKIDPAVRAVVSSGYSNDPVMAQYKQYGFSAVLAKPYRLQQLSEVLHKLNKSNNH